VLPAGRGERGARTSQNGIPVGAEFLAVVGGAGVEVGG
jgi:hypothetical protein